MYTRPREHLVQPKFSCSTRSLFLTFTYFQCSIPSFSSHPPPSASAGQLTLQHLLSTSCPVYINMTMVSRLLSTSSVRETIHTGRCACSGCRSCRPSTSHFGGHFVWGFGTTSSRLHYVVSCVCELERGLRVRGLGSDVIDTSIKGRGGTPRQLSNKIVVIILRRHLGW
jgi:hypothetical protein